MLEIIRFTISGIIPSKKNEHEIRRDKKNPKRVWIAPSDTYQTWEQIHAHELSMIYPEYHKLKWPLAIEYVFHPMNLRRFDMSNKIESINDMLILSQIIDDDNIFVLSELHPYLWSMSTSWEMRVEVIVYQIELSLIQRLYLAVRSL